MFRILLGTVAAALVAGGAWSVIRTSEAATAHGEAIASTEAAWAVSLDVAEPTPRDELLNALRHGTDWILVNRLTDERCRFERSGRKMRLAAACRAAMSTAPRVRRWRVNPNGVTMADRSGAPVMRFEWNEETGLSSVTGQYGALALLPIVPR